MKITEQDVIDKAGTINVNYIKIFNDNNRKKVQYYCPEHNKIRETDIYYFVHKQKYCACTLKGYTKEEFIFDIHDKPVKLIGDYINDGTKTSFQCRLCDNIWEATPNKIKQGRECPKCKFQKLHNYFVKNTDDFKKELFEINPLIEVTGEYINANTTISYICKKCKRTSYSTPNKLLHLESSCHFCKKSLGEQLIEKFLEENNINFIPQYRFKNCKYQKPLPFDFYLPDYNICIEFQGEQHFKPVDFSYTPTDESKEKAKKVYELTLVKDKIKFDYCEINNIELLYINYNQKQKINKILKEYLKL